MHAPSECHAQVTDGRQPLCSPLACVLPARPQLAHINHHHHPLREGERGRGEKRRSRTLTFASPPHAPSAFVSRPSQSISTLNFAKTAKNMKITLKPNKAKLERLKKERETARDELAYLQDKLEVVNEEKEPIRQRMDDLKRLMDDVGSNHAR